MSIMTESAFKTLNQHPTDRRALLAGIGGLAAGTLLATGSAHAGPLTPPGPPAPTGRTLTEIEPRIPVNAETAPGNAQALHVISQPGSYYLTQNILGVSGRGGIEIAANNVTLDLMGFTLRGVPGSLQGIFGISGNRNIVIRNGAVADWGGAGIIILNNSASQFLVEDVTVTECTGGGFALGTNAIVRNCIARGNGQSGFAVRSFSSLFQCIAQGGNTGFTLDGNTSVQSCVASQSTARGFNIGVGTTLLNCAASGNGQIGFIGTQFTIQGCTATQNAGGIFATGRSLIQGNLCDANTAAGIQANGSRNRIEGNTCSNNGTGILLSTGGHFVIRNTCMGNATNWDVAAGNAVLVGSAVTSAAFTGDSGGAALGSANPYANFSM